MADASLAAVIRHVRGLCAAESARERTDGQLLQTFACQRDPADRYATAEALAEDLRRFLADRPIRARRA
jgi:serine/threonine-protein kinase